VRSLYGSVTFRRSNASSNHSASVTSDGSITVDNIYKREEIQTELLRRMVQPAAIERTPPQPTP